MDGLIQDMEKRKATGLACQEHKLSLVPRLTDQRTLLSTCHFRYQIVVRSRA